jgi:hypothetical protein
MQGKICGFTPVWMLSLSALLFAASLPPAPALAQAQPSPLPRQIHLGNATVELSGQWRFHPGDSPLFAAPPAASQFLWAQPRFDDAAWATQNLTPPPGSTDPLSGVTGFVPGWTAQGYPNLVGYAWYRISINVDNASPASVPLAIRMPEDVDDAYQIYVNGQLIGHFGDFAPHHVTFYNAKPLAFTVPSSINSGPITIAIRMWMDPGTPLVSQDAGGLHGTVLLGQAPAIQAMLKLAWDDVDRGEAMAIIRTPLLVLAVLLGFTLFWLDRREPAYLWLALASGALLLNLWLTLTGYYADWLSMATENFFSDVVLTPLSTGLWVIFWGYWFGLAEMRRIHRITWGLFALLVLSLAPLRAPLYGSLVPASASTWLLPLTEVCKFAFGAIIFWVVYRGIRTRGIEGWLALPAVLLMPLWLYSDEMLVLHLQHLFNVLGIAVGLPQIAFILMLAAIVLLMMRRFVHGQREREQMTLELEQARQVQHVLIPEALPEVPGFALHSEYRPAQQVGGDFFQILPLAGGEVLLVIGDVSGKGMPAAMTVSLLVGTIRTLVRFTHSPREILEQMNNRMIGRVREGFTTCLILRVGCDGAVTAANAGHLSPYVDGREVSIENGLPLGLEAASTYPETVFRLDPGQQLTLLTDGVAEARDSSGVLFGFDRAAAVSTQPAGHIADTAQAYGQQDDITVLTLIRPLAAAV